MQLELSEEHITDYERAVCYYTLPKVTGPVTFGLVAVYAVCVLEAVGALAYGLLMDNRTWTVVGAWVLAGIVLFGMAAFMARAFINEWNERSALKVARNVPDADPDEETPDPFVGHILLRRPHPVKTDVFACVTRDGDIEYYIEIKRVQAHWRVSTAQDVPSFDVLALRGASALRLFGGKPARLGVYADNQEIASIVHYATLLRDTADVFTVKPLEKHHTVQNGCIYDAGRLVGRLYALRGELYLDIEREHVTPGILAYYASLA